MNDDLIDERRRRIHAIAEVIDNALTELDRFCLVIFPNEIPADQERVQFDIITSHTNREYVATVLQNVIDGIDAHLEQPVKGHA